MATDKKGRKKEIRKGVLVGVITGLLIIGIGLIVRNFVL